MKTYIYILQCPITMSVKYVGKSNNPYRRFQSHLWDRPKVKTYCDKWIKSITKTGKKPILTIIDETEDNWQELEKYWIEQFKCWGFKLTNITEGGEGSYGAGKWNNKSVFCYNMKGDFLLEFKSQTECSNYFKVNRILITAIIKRKSILLKKYQLRTEKYESITPYEKNTKYNWKNKPEIYPTSKSIICLEDNKKFTSITEASKYYNISISSISNILKGRSSTTRHKKSFKYNN